MPTPKERLLNALPGELIIDLTEQLVAIPTPNPPGQEKACAEFIAAKLQSWGLETEVIPAPDPERPQIVAWRRGAGGGPTVILNGHMDTVDPGDEAAWETPPYAVTRRGERLYGRGTCDMKGSLAIGMTIMKTLHEAGVDFPGTVMFQAVMGEEMDEPGTRTLLHKGYTGDYAIVLEPTDLRIGPASRGVAWHKISLAGPSVHCGLAGPDVPDLTVQFSRIVAAIADYHHRISAQKHPLMKSPSCRITQVEAGEAHNALAGRCQFITDRRMLPGETYQQVTTELRQILDSLAEDAFAYEIEFLEWNEPVETALDSPLIETLKQNIAAVGGREPVIWGPPYGSDVRNFIYDANIPTVNFGAGDYRVCHQPNEFVRADDLVTCARIVLGAVVDLVGSEE